MNHADSAEISTARYTSPLKFLLYFFFFYFLMYTIIPSLLVQSVFPDSAENLALSHALSWSYSKHPPLGMFTLHLLQTMGLNNQWAAFTASTICLLTSLLFIYKISLLYLEKNEAVIATILSSLSYYFMLDFTLQYNQNTIMLPFWVASIYFFIKSTNENKMTQWLLLGCMCALGVLAKYESLLVIGCETIYLTIIFKKKYLKNLLVATAVFLAIITPHIYWLIHHPVTPINFFTNEAKESYNHIKIFVGALILQPANLCIALLALVYLVKTKKASIANEAKKLNNPLLFLAFTPWIFFTVIAIFIRTHTEWGFPILALWIPALFYFFNIKSSQVKKVFQLSVLTHTLIFITGMSALYFSKKTTRGNYPSQQIANSAQQFWANNTTANKPLRYIGSSSDSFAYYAVAYSPKKVLFLKHNDFKTSSWINRADFYKNGGVLIDVGCNKNGNKPQHFNITKKQCFYAMQTNKLHPSKIYYTLYLVSPEPKKA